MKVIILGGGQVGYSIARYLAFEENDITIVDQSAELLKRISDKIDIQPVVGFASHPNILKQAGADSADLIIAVTASDEVNMVACEVAQSIFQVETKIARVRHQSYLQPAWSNMFHPSRLAIDVIISPEIEVAKSLNRSAQVVGAFEVIPLAGNLVKVVGVRCQEHCPLINTPLRLLPGLVASADMHIVCVYRGEQAFIPEENDMLKLGDEVHFIATSQAVSQAMISFGYQESEGRQMLIVGAGSIGKTLAVEIEKDQPDVIVKMIEKNTERSEMAARSLKNTEVLHGDALDYDILNEASIQNCETVIAVTDDDKVNILSSLLAKRCGAKRALALLNNIHHSSLVTSLGVDAVINPRSITVSTILQYVRQGSIRSVHTLGDGYAEIIEAEARETSHIIGLTVDDITIKGAIMIAAIVRNQEVLLAPTKAIISVGDSLIIIARKETVKKVERLFSIRPSYL